MCHANLDTRQAGLPAEGGRSAIPVLYFTEAMGLAMGHKETRKWLATRDRPHQSAVEQGLLYVSHNEEDHHGKENSQLSTTIRICRGDNDDFEIQALRWLPLRGSKARESQDENPTFYRLDVMMPDKDGYTRKEPADPALNAIWPCC
jgi:hypothetical protein